MKIFKKFFSKSEQMVYYLTKVKQFPLRIKLMVYKLQFEDIITPLQENLRLLSKANGEVLASTRFPKIMNLTLMLANHLNAGGRNANMQGIRLSGLQKLTMTKSSKGVSLLQFLIDRLHLKDPDVLELENDYPAINKAKVLSSITMNADMKQLKTGLDSMIKAIDGANSRGDYSFQGQPGNIQRKSRSASGAPCKSVQELL